MSFQTIGVGSSANDGTGDPIRMAFQKINTNFGLIAVGTFTLAVSATSTTVTLTGATTSSKVIWSATTADASSVEPFLYGTCGSGVLNLTHPSNAAADMTFSYIAFLF